MSAKNKKKNTAASSSTASENVPSTVPAPEDAQTQDESFGRMIREVFESIAIALVLAFLFRTFLAEMFVIPTGSMAPTLFGQHKDVTCPECGAPYQVGVMEGNPADFAVCPNCSALMDFKAEEKKGSPNPNYSGDRILVGKYPYYFSTPKRWDVVVFLFPGGANTNFIKRCVGLPGETIQIRGGDIYVKPPQSKLDALAKSASSAKASDMTQMIEKSTEKTEELPQSSLENVPFRIARKPPEKILATMLPVYENDYQSPRLRKVSSLPRWHQMNEVGIGQDTIPYTPWKEHEDGREFYFKAARSDEMTGWLVYQNLVPTQEEWRQVEMGQKPALKPRLITDMTAYNSQLRMPYDSDFDGTVLPQIPIPSSIYGLHWVKDLVVECTVDVRSLKTGEFQVGLARGSKTFWCKVNLATGQVSLEIPARPDFGEDVKKQQEYDSNNQNRETAYVAKAQSPMNGTDIYRFRFANVDDQLHVWVDGKVLKFDLPTAYTEADPAVPTENDLQTPVQIGCKNCEVNLSKLNLYRDIYYVARGRDNNNFMSDFIADNGYGGMQVYSPEIDFYSDPAQWEVFKRLRSVEFKLEEGSERQYFMMGDNSTNSADCRCWTYPDYDPRGNSYVMESYVPESLLVGEAYFVYWPHPWKPFWPNFGKFRKIK